MKRILALIPFLFIFLLVLLIFNFSKFSISIFSFIIILFMFIIFWEINKYVNKFATKLMLVVCIFMSNLFYGLGTIFYLFGLRKLIEKSGIRFVGQLFVKKKRLSCGTRAVEVERIVILETGKPKVPTSEKRCAWR